MGRFRGQDRKDKLGTLRSGKFNTTIFALSKQYTIDGCKILAFYIPEVETKPVYFGNPINTFIRMGSGDQRATEGEIRAMFRNQSFGKKTEETIPESGIEMLNLDTLHNYRSTLGETGTFWNWVMSVMPSSASKSTSRTKGCSLTLVS